MRSLSPLRGEKLLDPAHQDQNDDDDDDQAEPARRAVTPTARITPARQRADQQQDEDDQQDQTDGNSILPEDDVTG